MHIAGSAASLLAIALLFGDVALESLSVAQLIGYLVAATFALGGLGVGVAIGDALGALAKMIASDLGARVWLWAGSVCCLYAAAAFILWAALTATAFGLLPDMFVAMASDLRSGAL